MSDELMPDEMALDLWLDTLNGELNEELAENGKSDVSDLMSQRYSILKRLARGGKL
jgi:hypothetical protein